MKFQLFTVNPFQENTWLVVENKEAIIIDPGFFNASEFSLLQEALNTHNADLKAVILTHAHVDHVLGLRRVLEEYRVPVYLSHKDLFHWENYPSQAALFGLQVEPFDFTPLDLPEGENWNIGAFNMDVLHTPGHAPEHMSLYFRSENVIIAGDVIFREGIGRTDLYKGSFSELEASIKQKIYTLPGNTIVYPGHGPETTVKHEMANNNFVTA